MSRTAASITTAALQIAKCPLYTSQALDELNSLLRHIELSEDYSAARGQWNFQFSTNLITTGQGNIIQTAGAPLPIDYIRVGVSGGSAGAQRSFKWYLQGVAYDMIPVDLAEFDDQVQQAGIQSYPYLWAVDLAQYQPVIEVTGDLAAGSQNVANLAVIDAGTLLTSILAGMSIAGGLGPISAIPSGATVATYGGGASLVLSAASPVTMSQATLMIGNPGLGLMYPPPSGAFAAMFRYQRRMPRLTQAQVNNGAYCWFEDDMALVDGLAGLMSRYSDDARTKEFIGDGLGAAQGGRFGNRMAQTRDTGQDLANRAQTIILDRRRWTSRQSDLRNTKTIGW